MGGNDRRRIFAHRCGALLLWAALPVIMALMTAGAVRAADGGTDVASRLRARLGELHAGTVSTVQGEAFGALAVLEKFYAARHHEPAWADDARVAELLSLLDAAPEHGLEPEDFFTTRLHALAAVGSDEAQFLAERDLLFTEALLRYGYQRRFGKVDPRTLEPTWNFSRRFAAKTEPADLLAAAVEAPSLPAFLAGKLPPGPWYSHLQHALAQYRRIEAAGGWPALPAGPALRVGDRDGRVALLRERLRIEGDLPGSVTATDAQLFDEPLADAVRTFQRRHALAADGVVGRQTLAVLDVPVAQRVAQLRLSLERVRWLRSDAAQTYVAVNVAGFNVGFVREQRLVWSSRVVVGRAARQTPVFRGLMTYVETNPTWTIPPTILREDVLPAVRRDPDYLRREHITVLDHAGRRIDPSTIDWRTLRSGSYVLRQEPGPDNALGRIKLMFPNRHSVYLHDTPAKQLFEQPQRSFSSGCIRVEDPLALAELVLDAPHWRRADLEAAIATGETRRIALERPVPVLVVYLTALADAGGTTWFYRDVYGRDPSLLAALTGPVRLNLPEPQS